MRANLPRSPRWAVGLAIALGVVLHAAGYWAMSRLSGDLAPRVTEAVRVSVVERPLDTRDSEPAAETKDTNDVLEGPGTLTKPTARSRQKTLQSRVAEPSEDRRIVTEPDSAASADSAGASLQESSEASFKDSSGVGDASYEDRPSHRVVLDAEDFATACPRFELPPRLRRRGLFPRRYKVTVNPPETSSRAVGSADDERWMVTLFEPRAAPLAFVDGVLEELVRRRCHFRAALLAGAFPGAFAAERAPEVTFDIEFY
jgi:hypothetical protein